MVVAYFELMSRATLVDYLFSGFLTVCLLTIGHLLSQSRRRV